MKKRKRKNKKKKVKPANHSKEHPERKSCEKKGMKGKETDQQKSNIKQNSLYETQLY